MKLVCVLDRYGVIKQIRVSNLWSEYVSKYTEHNSVKYNGVNDGCVQYSSGQSGNFLAGVITLILRVGGSSYMM